MLREYPVFQRSKERTRRWFADESFDLVLWSDHNDAFVAFELSYGKPHFERTVTWSAEHGYGSARVDAGEDSPLKNQSPVVDSPASFPKADIIATFIKASVEIDQSVAVFVLIKLREYPQ